MPSLSFADKYHRDIVNFDAMQQTFNERPCTKLQLWLHSSALHIQFHAIVVSSTLLSGGFTPSPRTWGFFSPRGSGQRRAASAALQVMGAAGIRFLLSKQRVASLHGKGLEIARRADPAPGTRREPRMSPLRSRRRGRAAGAGR